MGLTFVRANSQYAEAAGSPLSGTISAFSIAAWCKPADATDATSTAFSVGRSGANHYIALGKTSSGVVFLEVSESGTASDAFSGTMSTGTWQHIAGVQASATSRVSYLDGVAGSPSTANITPNGLNLTTLGGLIVAGSRVSFISGDVGHVAIWSTPLTAGEIASLAAGARPDTVSPGSLVFYSEVDGNASPEEDLVGSLDLVWGAGGEAPSQSADDPPIGGTVFERSVSLTAASSVVTSSQRDLQRSTALTGTSSIAVAGVFFHVLGRQTALTATTSVATAGQRDVLRNVVLTAVSSVATARQLVAYRAVAISALSSIVVNGLAPTASLGRLEGRGGVSFTESSSGVSALIE